MTLTDYILYSIWCLFPIFFLLVALWAKLEKISDKQNREDIGDYLRQVWFLSLCVALSIFIDQKYLPGWVEKLPMDPPLLYFRIVLFPLMMFLLGKVFGSAKKIDVEKNPLLKYHRPNKNKK